MRHFPVIMATILAACIRVSATGGAFAQAQAAYDDKRYAEAAMLYENMLENGTANTEVRYNLANSHFKNGDLPQAVRHYRKAWYRAPRDPDIRANLHFALNAAGAADPSPGMVEQIFATLSLAEWAAVAVGGYLALTALLLAALLVRPARRTLLKLAGIPCAAMLLAGGGWWQWSQLRKNPEGVIVKTGTTALYGPVAGATAHFKLPPGALVRQRGTDPKGWVEVEYDGKAGWVEEANIERLSP